MSVRTARSDKTPSEKAKKREKRSEKYRIGDLVDQSKNSEAEGANQTILHQNFEY